MKQINRIGLWILILVLILLQIQSPVGDTFNFICFLFMAIVGSWLFIVEDIT